MSFIDSFLLFDTQFLVDIFFKLTVFLRNNSQSGSYTLLTLQEKSGFFDSLLCSLLLHSSLVMKNVPSCAVDGLFWELHLF